MENGIHVYLLTRDSIENGERKAANDNAPESAIDNRERLRIANDSQQRFVDALHELQV